MEGFDSTYGIIAVLGMHRSGTSLITNIISSFGVNVGSKGDLILPTKDNAKGFWELKPFVDMNETILKKLNSTSISPPEDITQWLETKELHGLKVKAKQLISQYFGENKIYVWKDPRSCITFEFWKALLPSPLIVVIPYRNPLEIAASLKKRDKLPKEVSIALWEWYTVRALNSSIGLIRIVVSYDDMIEKPVEVARKLFSLLKNTGLKGMNFPGNEHIESIVDRNLRHHVDMSKACSAENNSMIIKDQLVLWAYLEKHKSKQLPVIDKFKESLQCIKLLRYFGDYQKLLQHQFREKEKVVSIMKEQQSWELQVNKLTHELQDAKRALVNEQMAKEVLLSRVYDHKASFSWRLYGALYRYSSYMPLVLLGRVSRFARYFYQNIKSQLRVIQYEKDQWRPCGNKTERFNRAIEWYKSRQSLAGDCNVSIVITCHNDGEYLPDLLLSLKAQTLESYKIILIDDNSTDKSTLDIIHTLEQCVSQRDCVIKLRINMGVSAARNVAIQCVDTPYVACIDADDILNSEYLQRTVSVIKDNADTGFVYFDYRMFGREERLVTPSEFNAFNLINDNYVVASALFRREAWLQVGGYCEQMKIGFEDWEFWVHLIVNGWKGHYIPETLFYYRQRKHSYSRTALKQKTECSNFIRERHLAFYKQYEAAEKGLMTQVKAGEV